MSPSFPSPGLLASNRKVGENGNSGEGAFERDEVRDNQEQVQGKKRLLGEHWREDATAQQLVGSWTCLLGNPGAICRELV